MMYCIARKFLSNVFSVNQENGIKMTFVVEATKISLKNLKI